jgi:uroporphyrinogen decarboxylase
MSTKRELVLKAFHNEPVERVPVLFTHHYLGEADLNDGLNDPTLFQKNIDGAKAFKDEFDPDIVKIMTDGYFFLPYDYASISSVKDLKNIKPLDESGEYFTKSVELVQEYRKIYGDDILVFYNIFAPLTQLRNGVQGSIGVVPGTDPVLEFLKEDPDAVQEALDVIASDLVKFLPRVIGAGLSDGIYLSVTNPNRQIPADTYSTYIAPGEKKILAAAKELAPDHILHICGYQENRNILSVYPEYDVSVINWAVHAEQFGLKEGKELFGGRAVIGGFDQTKASVLYKGSKEEIEAYVEKLIDEVGTTGVIIGADCTVPADIDVAHLQWARQKAEELSR